MAIAGTFIFHIYVSQTHLVYSCDDKNMNNPVFQGTPMELQKPLPETDLCQLKFGGI